MNQPQRMISEQEARKVLQKGEYGVLCTALTQGQPYGVPVNYCYDEKNNCLYFHGALTGKKLDAIAGNDRVSFVVVTASQVVAEKIDTRYESAIVTGSAALVADPQEALHALVLLCQRLAPEMAGRVANMDCMPRTAVVKITIEEITGKRNEEV